MFQKTRIYTKELWQAIASGFWNSDQWLFGMLFIVGLFLAVMCYTRHFLPVFQIPATMVSMYGLLLGVYNINCEVTGWTSSSGEARIRPGELFTLFWVLTAIFMQTHQCFSKNTYVMPEEVWTIILMVVGAFFGKSVSKTIRISREKKKKGAAEAAKQ